jgi:FkbM family methyltransferase
VKPAVVNGRWRLILPDSIADWDAISRWEVERFASMEHHLRHGMTLFDVGAEHGWISAIYASFVGAEHMVLIEPTGPLWGNIRLTWEHNALAAPLATVRSLVGHAGQWGAGEAEINVGGWPDCSIGGEWGAMSYTYLHEPKHLTECPVTTIDRLARTAMPDAITIDVEGAELDVLRGADMVLRMRRPLVWVSIHPDLMARDYAATPEELLAYMAERGYDGEHLGTDHEQHWLFSPC